MRAKNFEVREDFGEREQSTNTHIANVHDTGPTFAPLQPKAVGRPQPGSYLQMALGNHSVAQMLAPDSGEVHRTAQAGVQGSGGRLPYFNKIQKSFGRHDIGGVKAYSGVQASSASRAIGAKAYAVGNRVAFDGTPSLHTAAHEAAHTVQQQAGVQLQDGIGRVGDRYERHADAVADAVVQGKSAESLLDTYGPDKHASTSNSVQRQLATLDQDQDDPSPISVDDVVAKVFPAIGAEHVNILKEMHASPKEFIFTLHATYSKEEPGVRRESIPRQSVYDEINKFLTPKGDDPNVWNVTLKNVAAAGWMPGVGAMDGMGISWEQEDQDIHTLIDLTHFGHLTQTARTGFERVNNDNGMKRTKAMALPTGLPYQRRIGPKGKFQEFGVLGGVLISLTIKDGSGNEALDTIRNTIKRRWATIECNLEEPRHIGTHDGYNMGTKFHFHLVKMGGGVWTPTDLDAIDQIVEQTGVTFEPPRDSWADRKVAHLKKVRSSRLNLVDQGELSEFLSDDSVSGEDLVLKQEILAVYDNDKPTAYKLWKAAKGWLEWEPAD